MSWPLTFALNTHIHKRGTPTRTASSIWLWLMSLRLALRVYREHSPKASVWVCVWDTERMHAGEREGLHWFDKQKLKRRRWWPLAFCACVYGHENDWVLGSVCDFGQDATMYALSIRSHFPQNYSWRPSKCYETYTHKVVKCYLTNTACPGWAPKGQAVTFKCESPLVAIGIMMGAEDIWKYYF